MHHPSDQTEKETKYVIKSKTNFIVIAKNLHWDFPCCFTCHYSCEYPFLLWELVLKHLRCFTLHDRYALNLDYFPIRDTADCQTPLSLIWKCLMNITSTLRKKTAVSCGKTRNSYQQMEVLHSFCDNGHSQDRIKGKMWFNHSLQMNETSTFPYSRLPVFWRV